MRSTLVSEANLALSPAISNASKVKAKRAREADTKLTTADPDKGVAVSLVVQSALGTLGCGHYKAI